ncbi:hypothetical protein BGZ95_010829 [Linnemannia exigua]|uniref:Uncharacterized protein n=1 Tax=Linnemannia exigua TaxID=604196 RepID=A0AAD4DKC5_9FUNG|nr:hypothetical protein BGZ95_010829 [Linnemannia exigua]
MSSSESTSCTSFSSNVLFREQTDFLLQRRDLSFENLLESFHTQYGFKTSGALSDALIKGAKRILNSEPEADIESWAQGVIDKTKVSIVSVSLDVVVCCFHHLSLIFLQSNVFTTWYRKQKQKLTGSIISKAGRRHIQQVVGEVSQSFSAVTSALGNSARSELPNPLLPASSALTKQKTQPSQLGTTSRKRGLEEQALASNQESEEQEHEHSDRAGQRRRVLPQEQLQEPQPYSDRTDQRHRFQSQERLVGQNLEQSAEPFRIEPKAFEQQEYWLQGIDVGKIFLDFQQRSTRLVNRLEEKATLCNLRSFLAMNYIWDMEYNLPTLSEDVFSALKSQYTCALISISKEEITLCWDLDQELMKTGAIAGRAPTSAALDRVVFIYQSISMKLPVRYLPFCDMNEDSFAHGVLDVFFSTIFPVGRPMDFYLSWANRPAQGSKYRRGNPMKPDGTISKAGHELVFLEIKPPRMEKDAALFLEDYWKLANLCKDAIDLYLGSELGISTMVAIQVFGHEMAMYKMTLTNGIYHWAQVMTAHLPKAKSDRAKVDRCVELMLTLKAYLETINTDPFLRTPSPTSGKKTNCSNLTPTKRPLFGLLKQT